MASKPIEISRRSHWSWPKNGREAHSPPLPRAGYSRCPCPSPATTAGGEVLVLGQPAGAARAIPWWPEHNKPNEGVLFAGKEMRKKKKKEEEEEDSGREGPMRN